MAGYTYEFDAKGLAALQTLVQGLKALGLIEEEVSKKRQQAANESRTYASAAAEAAKANKTLEQNTAKLMSAITRTEVSTKQLTNGIQTTKLEFNTLDEVVRRTVTTKEKLNGQIKTNIEVFDRADNKLKQYNSTVGEVTKKEKSWLDGHPKLKEYLNNLSSLAFKFNNISEAVTNFGGMISKVMSVVTAPFVKPIENIIKFGTAMQTARREVQLFAGKDSEALIQQANALSAKFSKTRTEVLSMQAAMLKSGLSAENTQKLSPAVLDLSKRGGGSTEQIGAALGSSYLRLNNVINNVGKGIEQARKGFRLLGVSMSDLKGLISDPEALFQKIGESLDKIPEQGKKVAILKTIFGDSWQTMLNIIQPQEVDNKLRPIFGKTKTEIIRIWEGLPDVITAPLNSLDNLTAPIFAKIAKRAEQLGEIFRKGGQTFDGWIETVRKMGSGDLVRGAIGDLFKDLGPQFQTLKQYWQAFWAVAWALVKEGFGAIFGGENLKTVQSWIDTIAEMLVKAIKRALGLAFSDVPNIDPNQGGKKEGGLGETLLNVGRGIVQTVKNPIKQINEGGLQVMGGIAEIVNSQRSRLGGSHSEQLEAEQNAKIRAARERNRAAAPQPQPIPMSAEAGRNLSGMEDRTNSFRYRRRVNPQEWNAEKERNAQIESLGTRIRAGDNTVANTNALLALVRQRRESKAGQGGQTGFDSGKIQLAIEGQRDQLTEQYGISDSAALKQASLEKTIALAGAQKQYKEAIEQSNAAIAQTNLAINNAGGAFQTWLLNPINKFKEMLLEVKDKFGEMIDSLSKKRIDISEKLGIKTPQQAATARQKLTEDALKRDERLLGLAQSPEERARIQERMADRAASLGEATTNKGDKERYGSNANQYLAQAEESVKKAEELRIKAIEIQQEVAQKNIGAFEKQVSGAQTAGGKASFLEQLKDAYMQFGGEFQEKAIRAQEEWKKAKAEAGAEDSLSLKRTAEATEMSLNYLKQTVEQLQRLVSAGNMTHMSPDPALSM